MRDLPAVRLILMNYFKSSEICKDSGKLVMDSYSSPFGNVVIMCGSQGLVGVLFGKQFELFSDEIAENFKKIRNRARKFKLQSKKSVKNFDPSEILIKTKNWLNKYFYHENPGISELPLAPIGTEFQHRVWRALCKIPFGTVVTYGELAKNLAAQMKIPKMSAQAVGGALAHNPISIIVPCHRVIGANGNLTGYGGGIDLKIQLLRHEGIDIFKFSRPSKGKFSI